MSVECFSTPLFQVWFDYNLNASLQSPGYRRPIQPHGTCAFKRKDGGFQCILENVISQVESYSNIQKGKKKKKVLTFITAQSVTMNVNILNSTVQLLIFVLYSEVFVTENGK